MLPTIYQPRLTVWGHTWRFVVVIIISTVAWAELALWQWGNNRGWFAADLALGLASLVLVHWRRRYPVSIATLTAIMSIVSGSAGGAATLALVSLATRRRWREIVPLTVLTVAAAVAHYIVNPITDDPWLVTATAVISIIGVSVGWGLFIGSRRELLAILRDRAERAEAEQSLHVEQARVAERNRIAREMHDVLAHRISTVAMHSGALSFRTDLNPSEIRRTASVIQGASHQALAELREVLGILRAEPGGADPELPQPSGTAIPALIGNAIDTGTNVEFHNTVDLDALPSITGRTLYRIVQEGLTNTRKHAPHTLLRIELSGDPGSGLTVALCNPLHIGDNRLDTPESGLGLIGLAERTDLAGGRFEHTITDAREFMLTAWLPWRS